MNLISSSMPICALFAEFQWDSLLLPLMWFGVIVITLIVESQTADLVSIWFAPGAFISLILAFCHVDFWIQFGVFIITTAIGLILTFTIFRPMVRRNQKIEKTNADALVGQKAIVEEGIDNRVPTGVVKINGQLWTARMENDTDTAIVGEWIEIVEVAGSKLICRPVTES